MIKKYPFLFFFAALYLFWLIIFFIQRVLFVSIYFELFDELNFWEILEAFYAGFRVDLSAAGYLMVLPLLACFLGFLVSQKVHIKIIRIILIVLIFWVAIIHTAELSSYSEWGHKLSSRVFMHLLNLDEVFRTTGTSRGFFSLFFILLESGISILLLRKFLKVVFKDSAEVKRFRLKNLILNYTGLLMGLACTFLFMRGGLQQIPINIDAAYFSNQTLLNDLSVNSCYYFGNSFFLFQKSDLEEHIKKNLSKQSQRAVDTYFQKFPADELILTSEKPNIVFIVFEGWSAHGVGAITGKKSATPFFDKLSTEGILFTHVYASNTTSEIGNATIFSGYTGVPESPLPLFNEKHRNLHTISGDLKNKGYETSYLFSGDLKYGNIKGFLTEHQFDRLKDENDFNPSLPKGKLNYYDEDLYTKFLKEIGASKAPFLACTFTGSTHFPYDCPMKKKPFKGVESDYLNSMIYADDCLRDFFKKARKKPWYKNTLFVLISDHGHNSPVAASPYDTETFRIPCLFVGPVIKKTQHGKKVNHVFSQADVAATLAYQLNLNPAHFPFSRNMLSASTQPGAFISTIRGFGFASDNGGMIYNMDGKKMVFNTYLTEQETQKNRRLMDACLKRLFSYFNQLDAMSKH